jgi:hypothetical protein
MPYSNLLSFIYGCSLNGKLFPQLTVLKVKGYAGDFAGLPGYKWWSRPGHLFVIYNVYECPESFGENRRWKSLYVENM